jgi:hypothetical protein
MDTSHINYFVTAGTLLAAFKRTDNAKNWCLTTHENDELTDFIRSLHDGEFPNDWRYNTIFWIISAIASEDEDTINWDDVPSDYADNRVDHSTSYVCQWYADHPARFEYVEENIANGITYKDTDAFHQLQMGQFTAIQEMTATILSKLNLI